MPYVRGELQFDCFLAGPWDKREQVLERHLQLAEAGYAVACAWAFEHYNMATLPSAAEHNLIELHHSHRVIVCADLGPSTTGGLWVELGYAMGRRIPCLLVGEPDNLYRTQIATMPEWNMDAVNDFLLFS